MARIGFSTGALACADFCEALRMSHGKGFSAIELSALRAPEVEPLLSAIPVLDLSEYEYVSFHAPSSYLGHDESKIACALFEGLPSSWPVILHPDASTQLHVWEPFGERLLIENMDRRKVGARFAEELRAVFEELPEASLCFDIGHARQVDPSMLEAYRILSEFGNRLREIHISEVNTASRHERLSYGVILAFQDVSWLIRQHPDVAVILETPVGETEMIRQAEVAMDALGLRFQEYA